MAIFGGLMVISRVDFKIVLVCFIFSTFAIGTYSVGLLGGLVSTALLLLAGDDAFPWG